MKNETFFTPSYDDIHQACLGFIDQIDALHLNIDVVVGIARGGLLPALILSHHLELPLEVVKYSSPEGKGDNKNHANILPRIDGRTLLIVDDICDSGLTMRDVSEYYTDEGKVCITASLFYKEHKAPVITPTLTWRTVPAHSRWVVFPFEKCEDDGTHSER